MNINQHNYEAFFLDYIEGNLSAEVVAELLLFMEENPALKEELDGFAILEVNDSTDISFNKEDLKVHVNKNNVEDFIIGSIEGVNSQADNEELASFVKNDEAGLLLLNRYKNTVLVAPHVSFPNKNSLKKKSKLVVLYPLFAVAASVLVFFMIFGGGEKREYNPQSIIATDFSTDDIEDSNDFIAIENPIVPEKVEKEENDITPLKNNPILEEYIPPRQNNNLALELKDSAEAVPFEIELPVPEDLIVVNDTSSAPKVDSTISFDEPSNNDLTMNEWANNQIRNKMFNQETEDVSKIKNDEVLGAIAGGLNKVSKKEIAYNNTASEGYTTKGFSIGKFEFSRTKRNKL